MGTSAHIHQKIVVRIRRKVLPWLNQSHDHQCTQRDRKLLANNGVKAKVTLSIDHHAISSVWVCGSTSIGVSGPKTTSVIFKFTPFDVNSAKSGSSRC